MLNKNIIDDGFSSHLVETALFDGVFEIPHIPGPKEIIIPKGMIPFSKRKQSKTHLEAVSFYEHDIKFKTILTSTDKYISELNDFPAIISPDCSLYRDMPFVLQITNTYMNRAIGVYLYANGFYVIPNVRWGDERTYTTCEISEKIAFLGVDRNSIVSIGTYGCIRGKENKYHFKAGLEAMLDELTPKVVLVYGSMPKSVFNDYLSYTKFVHYPDWTSLKRKKVQ